MSPSVGQSGCRPELPAPVAVAEQTPVLQVGQRSLPPSLLPRLPALCRSLERLPRSGRCSVCVGGSGHRPKAKFQLGASGATSGRTAAVAPGVVLRGGNGGAETRFPERFHFWLLGLAELPCVLVAERPEMMNSGLRTAQEQRGDPV